MSNIHIIEAPEGEDSAKNKIEEIMSEINFQIKDSLKNPLIGKLKEVHIQTHDYQTSKNQRQKKYFEISHRKMTYYL